MDKFTNQLINETSPYLLQHAHNPVNWFAWGTEALQKANEENKPILVSIGYSACHWCHVMERESFEDEATAQIMNELFVNIKIDREERPDLDHIYMDAVQAMTGSGGWPLNVFLTPDCKPFYGGTYFPPVKAYNRPSWKEILQSISKSFNEKRNEIDAQAENLIEHLQKANSFGIAALSDTDDGQAALFKKEKLDEAFGNIMKAADKEWGGFGKAPKFPQTFTIQFLLRYAYINQADDKLAKAALKQACLSLDKMIDGGIYDQIGGGFARYSTDAEWLAPHFEKMLYDNALLISVLSEAYQFTKNEKYKKLIEETIVFIERELTNNNGGFYAALDADSEGEEGKYYVWKYEEVLRLLGPDAEPFCSYYDITPGGNWHEGNHTAEVKNIPRVLAPLKEKAAEFSMTEDAMYKLLQKCKSKLLSEREKRIRPALDDKILLGWNALMSGAICNAYTATGNEDYRQLAEKNIRYLLKEFIDSGTGLFYHTRNKGEQAKYPAFLDDYAYLIQALLQLHEVTGQTEWLLSAKELTVVVIGQFSDPESPFFFYTGKNQKDVVIRKKEVYDGAVPSGNSIMAGNLYRLAILFDERNWKDRALKMLVSLGNAIVRYPTSFGIWASLLAEVVSGTAEIAIVGDDALEMLKEVSGFYFPHKIMMASKAETVDFPLLKGKSGGSQTLIYVCKDYACLAPLTRPEKLFDLMRKINLHN
jgi:uncharacterized protein